MTNTKGKITLLICLVLSLVMMLVLSSCDNTESPSSDSTNMGETSTDSSTNNLVHTHSEEIIPAISPTCTETGLTEGKKCSVCDHILIEQEKINATGHNYKNNFCLICNQSALVYELSDDESYYIVAGFTDEAIANLTIPSTYKELPVKSIKHTAFYGCKNLESVEIPNTVTSIGDGAFGMCTRLMKVVIPSSVTSINSYAFSNCPALEEIYINDIAAWCNISFGVSANPISGFNNTVKLYVNNNLLTNLVIPEGIASIKDDAFFAYKLLTSITFSNSVTSIGKSSFSGCDGLTNIDIPSSVTSIGGLAFYNCTSLERITIGDSVKSIGGMAFGKCVSLQEINFNAVAMNDLEESHWIFEHAGQNGEGIRVTIGKNVTRIPNYLFSGDPFSAGEMGFSVPSIFSVEFAEECVCESIGDYAFSDCALLTIITISKNIQSIGKNAFSGCYIKEATIPTIAISVIKSGALEKVVINGGTSIDTSAFENCSSLKIIEIPNSVTSIDFCAFYGCSALTTVTIPNSVTTMGDGAFRFCTSLTIYCEAESQPIGWSDEWNSSRCPVYWYSEIEPSNSGSYWHYGDNNEIVIW